MLWVALFLPVLLMLAVAVCSVIGARYPQQHTFTRVLRLRKPPEEVWKVVVDFARQGEWNPIVKSAERLPDRDGREVWKEQQPHGPAMILETVESRPPNRLVRSIADSRAAFSGRWEYALDPTDEGCSIRITEHGEVESPLFRFMVNLVGPGKYVHSYLAALAARLGEPDRKPE